MPSFISHIVMADDICSKINNIDKRYLRVFSLGGDLTKYAKCRWNTHHIKQDVFIDTLARKIKDYHLVNNKEAIGLLYGHIIHYTMDKIVHPLVYDVSKKCVTKHNHGYIEEYYDKYLVDKIIKGNVKNYTKDLSFKIKITKELKKILNEAYMEVYNTKGIVKYYRFNIFLYRILNGLYKIFGNKIYKISGLNRFLRKNKKTDLLGTRLLDSYNKTLELGLDYINRVNIYLKK